MAEAKTTLEEFLSSIKAVIEETPDKERATAEDAVKLTTARARQTLQKVFRADDPDFSPERHEDYTSCLLAMGALKFYGIAIPDPSFLLEIPLGMITDLVADSEGDAKFQG